MLEDFTMEKKSSGRSGQPPVKGNGTESKKNPDSVGGKIFPRTSRRREPVNTQSTKYETNRKPIPQKSKSIDKRPKPRGQYYGSGKEDSKVAEDEEVEYGGIVFAKGSKKQNLNHLLNFHYAPRDGLNIGHRNWRANPGGWGRSYASKSLKHKYNKEQFLQANCQFVVKSDGDYSSCMVNPDMLVDWECIEQIRLRSSEMLSCPICLYPPVAAKMTRCGHVFCWSCILHYLALSDKSWRKCPICYEAVYKQDLRSVIAVPHTSFSVGNEITLHLMKRKRGSLVALPVSQSEIHSTDKLLSISEKLVDTKYSKLLLASTQEVFSIIDKEKYELESQLADEQGCPEACFIEQALELLKERTAVNRGEKVLFQPHVRDMPVLEPSTHETEMFPVCEPLERGNSVLQDAAAEMTGYFHNDNVNEMNQNFADKCDYNTINHQRYESVGSEGLEIEDGTITVEDIEIPNSDQTASAPGGSAPKDFYFYQAADGQHIYLHAMNVRMLEHYYGCLKDCPLTLTGRIVEKETGSMTEDLRQRLRYLQHLPVTCQFEVAEIQLKPPFVNKETIEHFQDQLEIRKRRRMRRARDERRREKRINEEENKRWGRFPTPHISIDSHQQFPSCGFELENTGSSIPESATSSLSSSPAHTFDEFASVSSTLENVCLDENPLPEFSASPGTQNTSGPSFAQMLRDGKTKPMCGWPSVSNEKRKPKELASLPYGKQRTNSDSEPDHEGYVPSKQNFGDAIAQAMERAAAAAAATSSKDDLHDDPGSSGKKKKKQKQKQKLLFATGMACISK